VLDKNMCYVLKSENIDYFNRSIQLIAKTCTWSYSNHFEVNASESTETFLRF